MTDEELREIVAAELEAAAGHCERMAELPDSSITNRLQFAARSFYIRANNLRSGKSTPGECDDGDD